MSLYFYTLDTLNGNLIEDEVEVVETSNFYHSADEMNLPYQYRNKIAKTEVGGGLIEKRHIRSTVDYQIVLAEADVEKARACITSAIKKKADTLEEQLNNLKKYCDYAKSGKVVKRNGH